MASPFRYFRKHQGYILAVLGVILIVTWVIGPSLEALFDPSSSGRSGDNRRGIVAKWKGGNITRGELTTAGWEHEAVIRFLLSVVQRAQDDDVKPQAPFVSVMQDQIDLGLPMQTDDPTLVQILLFAHKGKEMGIVVDDKAVKEYLTGLSGYTLTEDADFYQLARETVAQYRDGQQGPPLVTVTQLFDRLKLELSARHAMQMFSTGLSGFSTGELWQYHEQLHRRDKIEAFPIKVADYVDRFKESKPPEEELRKIYDEGKDQIKHPERSEPGFRQPQKLAFEYVKVDFQKFLDEAKKAITDEQLQAEYEKEIAAGNFRNLKFDAGEDAKTTPEGTTPDPDKKTEDAKPDGKPKQDADQPGSVDSKTDGNPAGDAKGNEKSDASAADKAAPAKDAPAASDKPEKGDGSCQEEPQSKKEGEPAKDPAGDAAPEKKDDPKTTGEKSADDKSAGDKKVEPTQPEPEFRPLSEVRDQLLNKLASPAARSAHDSAINAVVRAVSDYGTQYTRWVEDTKAGRKVGIENPGTLNLGSILKKHGLKLGKTPLADQFAIAGTELGQEAAFRSMQGTVPFVDGAFFENRPLFAPQEASSITGETTFIYWRTKHEPSAQVPFEKAKPQVIAAWIHRQAVAAAKKEAEALAAKAAKAPSLKEALSEEQAKQVIEPLPFSWLTRGASPLAFGGSPSLSEVKGIPLAGSEFMKAVFSLNVGQSGVAIDQPHQTVYVVRVVAEEPALDIRREMFLSSMQAGIFGDLIAYARMASRDVMGDMIEELRKEYQLEWVGTPELASEM